MWELTLFGVVKNIIAFFVIITLLKNYIFLLLAPFHPIKEKLRYIKYLQLRKAGLKPKKPLITVIVPAWNEEVGVVKTINSIVNSYYKNIELIVINDGSTDKTEVVIKKRLEEIKQMKSHPNLKAVFISQKNSGKGVALNSGIQRANGEVILTVDADSVLKKDALSKLAKYYADPGVMAVVGNVEVANTKTLIGFAQHLEYYFGFYNKRAHAILGAEYIFGGACASFRSSVFKDIGYFDTKNKTEDIEMSMRIRAAGLKCTYAEDVICYTEGASDLAGLVSQRVRWKKGRIDTFIKYKFMFFSTEDNHNFFLSFFILPFSVLAEIQLLFEPIAIAILIIYSIIASEFLSLAIGITFIMLVYVAVSLFHDARPKPTFILLFPFTWPIFYFLDWIEFVALYKSLQLIRKGDDIVWQKWQRKGIKG